MTATRTVLLFGDSNTHGTIALSGLGDQNRFGGEVRWPGVCSVALGIGWRLIEEGHPGRTTVHPDPIEGPHRNGLMVLPAILESHRPIDIVVVMLGTNDLKARFSVTAFDIAAGVEKLVATIRTNGCGPDGGAPDILVVAPPPIMETGVLAEMFRDGARKSHQLAAEYAAMADRMAVEFMDAGTVIESDPVDGIHLTAQAHAALGRAIADKLKSM